ncbi:MAG TPA: hypothetical protein VLB83_04555 [Candidatus Paceibacterota bacterium]|nr:hypothetical protein [Candidatus Paceibacterota bacterium]
MSNDNQIERLWKLQATVNKLILDGKRDPREVSDILQGILESRPQQRWREEDGVIYFSVGPTDVTTGEGWITRLTGKGIPVGDSARELLRSSAFKPTSGVVTNVAVVNDSADVSDIKRIFSEDSVHARRRMTREFARNFRTSDGRRLLVPNIELACLILERLAEKEFGLMCPWQIAVTHEPFKNLRLLADSIGGGRLDAYTDDALSNWWHGNVGFAFEVAEV